MSDGNDRIPPPAALLDTRVVAVLRGDDPARVVEAGLALSEAGISCLEVTFTTPRATDALERLRARLPGSAALGAGTVLDAGQAREALAAGATFLVTPAPCPDVVAEAVRRGVPVLPGAFTPGEILACWRAGAGAVKVFPAATGGPGHVRDLRGPFPDIPLVPTGGIGLEDAAGYLAAGAIAVGLGSSLTGRLGGTGDGRVDGGALRARARALLDSLGLRSLAPRG
jgi:2-dehydro-3-deoxyphosphogluconate aldolase/(4S)-4-hydroxy-2-oxoglutarate aldolase